MVAYGGRLRSNAAYERGRWHPAVQLHTSFWTAKSTNVSTCTKIRVQICHGNRTQCNLLQYQHHTTTSVSRYRQHSWFQNFKMTLGRLN